MTTPEPRKKKPTPTRTRPRRTINGALRGTDSPPAHPAAAGEFGPLIERTIRTGYDLVEEYVQAGRAVAEKLQSTQSPKLGQDSSRDRMTEYITHLAFGALEYVQALSQSPAQPGPTGAAPPFAATAGPRANKQVKQSRKAPSAPNAEQRGAIPRSVQVSVQAAISVRVALQLRRHIGSSAVQAQAARRTRAGRGSSIEPGIAVQISATRQLTVANVQVNSKVAAGEYRSLLVATEDNLPCGHVTVQVLGDDAE